MKLKAHEMQPLFDSVNNATNIVRAESGQLLSFDFVRYYGTTKHNSKVIHVSLKSDKEVQKSVAEYLPEKDFFNLLADHIDEVTGIKLHCEKIYRFTLNGQKYKTDKSGTTKLFDIMPYADFKRVTSQRFWSNDGMLRNGYFSGMIGTYDRGIRVYEKHADEYDLYDVDFNAAYPYCFKMPLPTGRFYTAQEWENVKDNYVTSMKFYQIKVKTIENQFGVFVPPQPYIEYRDFDFLLQKTRSNMIVSEKRLSLIRQIYGNDAFVITREYICPTKIYLKLADFAQQLYDDIQAAKAANDTVRATELKVALNSLVGNFGRRDESKDIKRLRLIDNGIIKDVITVEWTEAKEKEQQNYLPLAMVINDITARRLFDMMTDENALRLCYNTDGGIVALRKGCRIVTSGKMGRLKATKIHLPKFYYTTMLYNRPLVYDAFTGKCYNTKSIEYDKQRDKFVYSETVHLNTRDGFIMYENSYPVVVEQYKPFNLRASEVIIRLNKNKLYKKLKNAARNDTLTNEMLKDAATDFERLCNPYDELYNEIRHKPTMPEHIDYEQQTFFNEKFFKFDAKKC